MPKQTVPKRYSSFFYDHKLALVRLGSQSFRRPENSDIKYTPGVMYSASVCLRQLHQSV